MWIKWISVQFTQTQQARCRQTGKQELQNSWYTCGIGTKAARSGAGPMLTLQLPPLPRNYRKQNKESSSTCFFHGFIKPRNARFLLLFKGMRRAVPVNKKAQCGDQRIKKGRHPFQAWGGEKQIATAGFSSRLEGDSGRG